MRQKSKLKSFDFLRGKFWGIFPIFQPLWAVPWPFFGTFNTFKSLNDRAFATAGKDLKTEETKYTTQNLRVLQILEWVQKISQTIFGFFEGIPKWVYDQLKPTEV